MMVALAIQSSAGLVGGGTSAAAANNQLEQLNNMREVLFSQDGWGCQHVKQDTNWDVPSSPEPTNKDPAGGPMWTPVTINNGTELWELNLRNGGQPPTQPVQKTPWGHTPSSNLGGTWGEDDDGATSSSVWTTSANNPPTAGVAGAAGVTSAGVSSSGAGNPPQWGQSAVGVGVNATGNATGSANVNLGGVSAVAGAVGGAGVNLPGNVNTATGSSSVVGSNWGDTRDLNSGTINMRGMDTRDPLRDPLRGASAGEKRDIRLMDPRDTIRGDPRGISGRLNGQSEMWGQHHNIAHNQMPTMNKIMGPGTGMSANAVVNPGGVSGMGPGGGVNTMNTGGVSGNANAHWGASAVAGGSKDISSLVGKVSGWGEPSPPAQRRNIANYDDGTSLWGQQTRGGVSGGSASHWQDITDPMNRNLTRNMLGSQNAANPGAGLGSASGNSLGSQGGVLSAPVVGSQANNPLSGVGGPQGRLGGGSAVGAGIGGVNQHNKPDNNMWAHANNPNVSTRNSAAASWGDELNHNTGINWMLDDKPNTSVGQLGGGSAGGGGAANSWNDPSVSWNKNQNKMPGGIASGWGTAGSANDGTGADLSTDWSSHSGIMNKAPQKMNNVNVGGLGNLNTELIKQSKQYRILVEYGFKKEEVERALINTNMNIEEAADLLRANAMSMDWRRREDKTLGSFGEHNNPSGSFPGRYPPTGNQATNMPFPPNIMNHNLSGNTVGASSNNSNLAALNSMQPPNPVQKYLNPTQQHNMASGHQNMNPAALAFGQGLEGNSVTAAVNAATNSNNQQPSAQQLRLLVQQIQLAVQSGYLSSQILSEPLSSSMLVLLSQLLTNIKHLQAAQQSLVRGGNNANTNAQINYAISKYKQQIQNLQTQINAQQAFMKQKQQQQQQQQQQPMPQNMQQQHPATHANNLSNLDYMRGQHDAINALQSNFSEMNLTKPGGYPGAPTSQSKLINQWKLPEKDLTSDSTDFSRAPGATTKQNTPSNTMGLLGLQNDGTWSSSARGLGGDGWPDSSTETENKDWSLAQHIPAATYTDLVPEFEPGKPWQGAHLKSIEDDPTITPGSVARSTLSINSTPKEATDIFTNPSKSSPTDLTPLSLSSSIWSFNPSSSNQNFQM